MRRSNSNSYQIRWGLKENLTLRVMHLFWRKGCHLSLKTTSIFICRVITHTHRATCDSFFNDHNCIISAGVNRRVVSAGRVKSMSHCVWVTNHGLDQTQQMCLPSVTECNISENKKSDISQQSQTNLCVVLQMVWEVTINVWHGHKYSQVFNFRQGCLWG